MRAPLGGPVGKQQRKALRTLRLSIRQNTQRVENKLTQSGVKSDPAVVYSAAKYYQTLKRLAKE